MINGWGTLAGILGLIVGESVFAADHTVDARCFTTDDGAYPCHMRGDENRGSIKMMAPGRPTHTLQLTRPDVATYFAVLEGKTVRLPAQFQHRPDDPGCWYNSATDTVICAWLSVVE